MTDSQGNDPTRQDGGNALSIQKRERREYSWMPAMSETKWKSRNFPYCKWNRFLFAGENATVPTTKNAPSNSKGNPQESRRGKNRFFHKKPGKRGPVSDRNNTAESRWKFFRPTHPPGGSKNVILCFLENMRYIRDGICTGHIRRQVYFSVPAG